MVVALLNLVETALRVTKQALGKRVGKPGSGGLAREAHIVAHRIRKEGSHSYAELVECTRRRQEVRNRHHPSSLPATSRSYFNI
jgi:hypothetical protein